MASQAQFQKKISRGYSIAAQKLGAPFHQYRALDTTAAIAAANLIGNVLAGFDIDYRFSHRAPGGYGHPVYFALTNLDNIQVGDYFTDHDTETYFIAGFEPLRPPLAVSCNRVVSIYQPAPSAAGPDFYSGNVTGLGDPQVTGWPCSILIGPKGEINASGLPADPRAAWYVALFPRIANFIIRTGDVMNDDLGRRYIVSATEQTDLGWRMTLQYGNT